MIKAPTYILYSAKKCKQIVEIHVSRDFILFTVSLIFAISLSVLKVVIEY